MIKASICTSAFNKPNLLPQTLDSIFSQSPPFEFEVIVVDDGSPDGQIAKICERYPVRYHRIEREAEYRNPCVARNTAYKMARGEILIPQSDEVVHHTPECIASLVALLEMSDRCMVFANVFCKNAKGQVSGEYTGPGRQRPFFFLGALYRKDMFAVGGNDEEFIICPAYEDDWLADCLERGANLRAVYSTDIVAYHLYHPYVEHQHPVNEGPSRELYNLKHERASKGEIHWIAAAGPWPYVEGVSFYDAESANADGELALRESEPAVIPKDHSAVFTDAYERREWGDGESKSGPGSSLEATVVVREFLPRTLKAFGIKSMLDIPCGDFHWMREVDLEGVAYTGADVVPSVVKDLKGFASDSRAFERLDLLTSRLPKVDLVFCRDGLVHMSYDDAKAALRNIVKSGARYLMATTFTDRHNSKVIQTGDWAPYNMQSAPFNLPKPIAVIVEGCREYFPDFTDKSLGLWEIDDSFCVPE